MRQRHWIPLGLTLLVCACDDGATALPATAPPRHPSRVCARDDEAALPDDAGALRCITVGADLTRMAVDLPDPRAVDPSLPEPVLWVRPGLAPGDGSRERPHASIGEAFTALPSTGGTIALAAGSHALPTPLVARGTLAIVGAGATHTVVITGQGQGAVVARGAVTVTLRGLSVAHDVYDVVTGSVADVSVTEGASATLRDVLFARPQTALRVEGAMSRAVADGLTVRGARGDAVAVYDAARATLRDVLLRDGRAVGVRCDASAAGGAGGRVQLVDALVAGNLGGGVRLAGRGVFNTGARCDAADLAASVGEDDCLLRVAVQGNTGAGVVATDARGVEVRRAHIGATRAGAAGAGDGVSIARGADVRFDDDLSTLPPETVLRRGTQVLENARAGVLVDGAGTALRVHGMLSGSNGGPGALLQQGAHAPAVNACVFSDNVGLGLGVSTGASVAAILCDQFLGARGGTWGAVAVGDGLSIYGGRFDAMRDNEMSGNARFGLVLSGVAPFSLPGVEALRNAGSGNGFGAAVYGAPMGVFDRLERITGRAPAPAADPGGVSTAL